MSIVIPHGGRTAPLLSELPGATWRDDAAVPRMPSAAGLPALAAPEGAPLGALHGADGAALSLAFGETSAGPSWTLTAGELPPGLPAYRMTRETFAALSRAVPRADDDRALNIDGRACVLRAAWFPVSGDPAGVHVALLCAVG